MQFSGSSPLHAWRSPFTKPLIHPTSCYSVHPLTHLPNLKNPPLSPAALYRLGYPLTYPISSPHHPPSSALDRSGLLLAHTPPQLHKVLLAASTSPPPYQVGGQNPVEQNEVLAEETHNSRVSGPVPVTDMWDQFHGGSGEKWPYKSDRMACPSVSPTLPR